MSISNETMAAIQHAGHALDAARAALAAASQEQSARLAEALAADAFGVENDAHFEHLKTIARMAQAVLAMEEQMKAIFQTAGEIAFEVPSQSVRGAARQPLRLAARAQEEPASDVDARTARAGKADASPRASRKTAGKSGSSARAGVPLKGNAARVMAYLASCLNRRGFSRVTHGDIASGAPIPTGSVGAAIASLKAKGLLLEGERGSYRLA